MDIEAFYDQDERRRQSAEIEFGTDWRDHYGVRYEVNWVEDTGELYTMREPVPHEWADPFGGIHVTGSHESNEHEVERMSVAVVADLPTQTEVERVLSGWPQAMEGPDSVHWLVDRLREAQVLRSPDPGSPLPT